jgi:acetyl-CoA carboxylase carboxyl transferase subunit alpha
MLSRWLPLEKPLVALEEQIEELKRLSARENIDLSADIARLEERKGALMEKIFQALNPWEKVQMARHPKRPYALDYINALCSEWVELHGDRSYGDDGAIVAGFGRLNGRAIAIVGNQKGRDTKERQERNFGQASPEGLRKAQRVMELAARYGRPIVTFVDTPGAYCAPEAEERGISEAIARNQLLMSQLPVPIVCVITGEGASGGAIALAVGNRVMMLEHAYYSVIAPESCASILYRDPSKASESAEALNITAQDAHRLGIIEEILPEPLGGAHRNFSKMSITLEDALDRHLRDLSHMTGEQLIEQRYQRYRKLGDFENPSAQAALAERNGAPQSETEREQLARAAS